MPERLTISDVEQIGALAHLELSEEEKLLFARQLAEILAYAEQISSVDTTGVPPTAGLLASDPVDRLDEVRPSLSPAEALANAPEAARDAGLFKVPRVLG